MVAKNYARVETLSELGSLLDRMGSDVSGFDLETGYLGPPKPKYSLHPETNFVVGISFTNSLDWARYAPLGHDCGDNLDPRAAAELLWPWLNQGKGVPFNAKFELRVLSRFFMKHLADHPKYGDEVRETRGYYPIFSDPMIEAYVLAEYRNFGLKDLTKKVFGHTMTELASLFPDLPKNKKETLRFNVLDLRQEHIDYACEDSLWALAHHKEQYPRVKDSEVYKIDMDVLPVVCDMEDYGIQYDWAMFREASREAHEFLTKFEPEIQADLSTQVGAIVQVNLNSPAQLQDVLFNKLGMKTRRYTKGTKSRPMDERKMSTDAIALAALAEQHEVVRKILDYKEIKRLLSNFLDKFERDFSYAADGRTHPDLMQAHVVTGRFAANNPSYQNSPKKYHYELKSGEVFDFNFRDGIVAPTDYYILGFDYSQAELRGLAGEAQEPELLDAFRDGIDVHKKTAALMLHVPLEQVTSKDRDKGKTLNFAIDYGMQAKSLADRLKLSTEEAQDLLDQYRAAYPRITEWTKKQEKFGRTNGYVLTKWGRRCPIWEYESDDFMNQLKGDRACINYPVQGAATGDMVRMAMSNSRKALIDAGIYDKVHLVMNIHDALNYYVHKSLSPQMVIDILEPAVVFPVPGWPEMVAEWYVGKRWGSVKDLEKVGGVWRVKQESPKVEAVSSTPVTVVVEIPVAPTEPQLLQLIEQLDAHPGETTVELRLPAGTVRLDRHKISTYNGYEAAIKTIMEDAKVYVP